MCTHTLFIIMRHSCSTYCLQGQRLHQTTLFLIPATIMFGVECSRRWVQHAANVCSSSNGDDFNMLMSTLHAPCQHVRVFVHVEFLQVHDSSHDRVVHSWWGHDFGHDFAQSNRKSYTWNDTLRGCTSSEKFLRFVSFVQIAPVSWFEGVSVE